MNAEELKDRTKRFGVNIIKYVDSLPHGRSIDVLARQLVKSATSVGSNYRVACVARSKAEFVSKLQVSLEEADESVFWLQVLEESGHAIRSSMVELEQEGKELSAILMLSLKTSRSSL